MLMKILLHYSVMANKALSQGVKISALLKIKSKDKIGLAKFEKDYEKLLTGIQREMDSEFHNLR